MKQLRIIIIAFIGVSVGAFAWITAGSDPETLMLERLQGADQQLIWLVLLICAFTLLSTLTGLPVFYLSLALGILLPFLPAMAIAWVVNVAAVMGTFYLVRFAFTSYFKERYGKKKLIKRINKRIRKYGFWSVAFSRAVYIFPTSLINFSFPLSHISSRAYLAGTLLGLVPECLVNVLTGHLIRRGVIMLSTPEARTLQFGIIAGFVLLFAAVFTFLWVRQRRQKKLRRLKAVPYKG